MRLVLKGEAKRYQGSKAGVYILQKKLANTYPQWKQKSNTNSIWFDFSNGAWLVGPTSELGLTRGWIQGPYGEDDWPQNISENWQYADEIQFHLAGSGDVVFEELSNDNFKIKTKVMFIMKSNSQFTDPFAFQTRIVLLARIGKY